MVATLSELQSRLEHWRAMQVSLEVALELARMREKEVLAEIAASRSPVPVGEVAKKKVWSVVDGRELRPLYYRVEEIWGFPHPERGVTGVIVGREYIPKTDHLGVRVVLLPEEIWCDLSPRAVEADYHFRKQDKKKARKG